MCEQPRDTLSPRKRPNITKGITERVVTGCGYLYVTVNNDKYGPCEVLVYLGKVGGCASAYLETVGRLISISLRSGVKGEAIIKCLMGIRCPSIAWDDGKSILSCSDGIATVLEKYFI